MAAGRKSRRRERRERRLERALAGVREGLNEAGLEGRLYYDDRYLGDILVLVWTTSAGELVELVAHRREKAPVLVLVAQSKQALSELSVLLPVARHSLLRKQGAARMVLRKLAKMAEFLLGAWELEVKVYPAAHLAALQVLLPEVQPMWGVEGVLGGKEHEEGAEDLSEHFHDRKSARRARRYQARFAVRVDTKVGARAVLHETGRGFRFHGVTARVAVKALAATGDPDPSVFGIVDTLEELRAKGNVPATDTGKEELVPRASRGTAPDAVAVEDAAETFCDMVDCWFDLPDLGDCVSCDCDL